MLISCPPVLSRLAAKTLPAAKVFSKQVDAMCLAALRQHMVEARTWDCSIAAALHLKTTKTGSVNSAGLVLNAPDVETLPFRNEIIVPVKWETFEADIERQHASLVRNVMEELMRREVANRHGIGNPFRELIQVDDDTLYYIKAKGDQHSMTSVTCFAVWCDRFAGELARAEIEARQNESGHERLARIDQQRRRSAENTLALQKELTEARQTHENEGRRLPWIWDGYRGFTRTTDEELLVRYRKMLFQSDVALSSDM